jgi:prepilin signal peptidase PulO-like enzyme (type II secretory pathway)
MEKGFKYPEIINKHSHCEKCKKILTWYELIPIIGYILQKGKCPKCNTTINIYYPISELILGISALLFYLYSVPWYLIIIFLFLFVLSYYDQKDNAVPQKLVHILLVLSVLIFVIYIRDYYNLIFPFSISLFLIIMNLFKKSFGLGDILVLLGIGILVSYKQYIVIFWLGIVIALLYSMYLIVFKKKEIKNTKVPMIPFFTISYVISILYGDIIFDYLLKYIVL